MKKSLGACLTILSILIVFSGCINKQERTVDSLEQEKVITERETEEQKGEPLAELTVINENRIVITLDNEAQLSTQVDPDDLSLQWSRQTLVSAKETHRLIIHFMDEMNKQQVEALLRERIPYQPEFSWFGNKLVLTIPPLPEENLAKHPMGIVEVKISLDGAETANREVLQNQLAFNLLLGLPKQMWQMSVKTGQLEAITDFTAYYAHMSPLKQQGYWLLTQWKDYCECDAAYPLLYFLYNEQSQTTHHLGTLPISPLTYQGSDPVWIDKRGLFLPDKANVVPELGYQFLYHPQGYIRGAAFLLDNSVIFAVGNDEEDETLDIVRLNLDTKQEVVYQDVIPGFYYSEMTGEILPTHFLINDQQVYFISSNVDLGLNGYYRFDLNTGLVESYEGQYADMFPRLSYDSKYESRSEDGIYHGEKKVLDIEAWRYHWSPTENLFFVTDYNPGLNVYEYGFYSLDQNNHYKFSMPLYHQFLSWSADGEWLYFFGQ